MKNIIKALIETQKNIENAVKDHTNPAFKSKYATLEAVLSAVKPEANKNGLVIVQTAGKDAEGHYVETKLYHESGESFESRVYLVLDKATMQGLGSAITYGRRYGLAAIFAIGQEDDDGNAASQPSQGYKVYTPPASQAPIAPRQSTEEILARVISNKSKDTDGNAPNKLSVTKPIIMKEPVAEHPIPLAKEPGPEFKAEDYNTFTSSTVKPLAVQESVMSEPLKKVSPRHHEIVKASIAAKWTGAQVKAYIKQTWYVELAAELTNDQVDQLIKVISTYSFDEVVSK